MSLGQRIYEAGCKCPDTPCPYHPSPNRPFQSELEKQAREFRDQQGFAAYGWSDSRAALFAAQVRAQTIEECAKIADELNECYDYDIEGCDGDELLRYTEGCAASQRIAKQIRALASPAKSEEGKS